MKSVEPATAVPENDPLGNTVRRAEPRERTPWLLGFLCFLIPALPSYSVPAGPLKSNGSPAKIIAVVLLGLALLGFVLIRRTARTRTVRLGAILILLYFLLELAIYGVGLTHLDSALIEANKARAIISLLANVGVVLYIVETVETARQRTIALGCLVTGLTFACMVGLLQGSAGVDLQLLLQPPGFVANFADQGRGAGVDLTDRFGGTRVFGTASHAIEFSVMAAVTVPLAIHFACHAANRQVRWLAALSCGVALLAMPAAISRTGVLTLVAALLVYMWAFKVRELGVAFVAGSVAVVGYIAAFPTTVDALWNTIVNSAEDDSIKDRTADYAAVSQTFHDNPVFGIGLGGSPPSAYGFLDNEWLQAIVQGGVVGVAAMIVLAGSSIFGISAGLRVATSPRERDQVYMMGSMLFGILVSSLFFDLFSYQQATLIFFVLFGLLWSRFTVRVPEPTTRRPTADHRV